MWLAAAFAAAGIANAMPGNSSLYEEDLSAKYGLGWAEEALRRAGAGAAEASRQALNVSQQATSAIGNIESQAANLSGQIGSIGTGVLGGAAKQGKLAAITAVLTYLGTCREYFAHLPEIRAALVPQLAESLQGNKEDPSESTKACEAAVKEGLDTAISEHMKQRESQEQMAIKWIAEDRAYILCSDKLMRALGLFECIREKYPKQYKEALRAELLLEVVTEQLLGEELFRVCGRRGGIRDQLPEGRLFEEEDAPALASAPGLRAAAPALAAGAGAALAALAAWRRLPRRGTRCLEVGELEAME